jgi:hypothetical protein
VYSDSIEKIKNEKQTINEKKGSTSEEKDALFIQQADLRNLIRENDKKYKLFEDAQEGNQIDEEIDTMEVRLQVLKNQITSDLTRLDSDLECKKTELIDKEDVLISYHLDESQYIGIEYDSVHKRTITCTIRPWENDDFRI